MNDQSPDIDPQAREVLHFWFDGDMETPDGLKRATARWFGGGAAFDAQIGSRFGGWLDQALHGELDAWAGSPRGWLALLIVLDQFPRNIHRGTAAAFSGDGRALALALSGIDRSVDQALKPIERVFAYLPLEHAEDLALQERSVRLFQTLAAGQSPETRATFDGFTGYAIRHRDVIARFGRFPHRNPVLGRTTTPDEQAYLDQPGSGF